MIFCHWILVYVKVSRKSSWERRPVKGQRSNFSLRQAKARSRVDSKRGTSGCSTVLVHYQGMPPIKSVKVIINAHSGVSDKDEARQTLTKIFEAAGVDSDISLANGGDEVAQLGEQAASEDWTVIVAGGGDGTINTVASHVIGAGKILGVLPLGTLNHFARDLKIPADLELAAQAIISGRTIKVDVGEVNGRIFLNNSSLGLYPTIVREREKKQRLGAGKWPAFVWAAVAALRRYPFLDVRLTADGKEFRRRTPFVFIGNNEYLMERFNIGGRECLDKGS